MDEMTCRFLLRFRRLSLQCHYIYVHTRNDCSPMAFLIYGFGKGTHWAIGPSSLSWSPTPPCVSNTSSTSHARTWRRSSLRTEESGQSHPELSVRRWYDQSVRIRVIQREVSSCHRFGRPRVHPPTAVPHSFAHSAFQKLLLSLNYEHTTCLLRVVLCPTLY